MSSGISWILALGVVVQAPAGAGRSLDVAAVLDRWDAGSKLIESYDLIVELESRSFNVKEAAKYRLVGPGESYPTTFRQSHVLRKGEKRFGEFGGDGKGRYGLTLLFDGELSTISMRGQNTFAIDGIAIVFGDDEYEDYEATYRTIRGTTDRIAASKERDSRLLPRDGSAYVVAVPSAKDNRVSYPDFTWKVWLDPAKNFMPIRLEQSVAAKSGGEVRSRDMVIELKEVAEGVWAPIGATISVYNKDQKSQIFGKVAGVHTLKVVQDRSRFNAPLADEIFASNIPDGAEVIDRIRNVVYTKGSSDPEGYLAKLAADGKQKLQGLSPADRGPPPLIQVPDQPGTWSTGRVVAAGVAALLVVAAATIGLRRLSERRP